MLFFMFYSIFSYNFACYIGETTFFATKVLLFSHIRKRETYFFQKKAKSLLSANLCAIRFIRLIRRSYNVF